MYEYVCTYIPTYFAIHTCEKMYSEIAGYTRTARVTIKLISHEREMRINNITSEITVTMTSLEIHPCATKVLVTKTKESVTGSPTREREPKRAEKSS